MAVDPAIHAEAVRRLEAAGVRRGEVDQETWDLHLDDVGEVMDEERMRAEDAEGRHCAEVDERVQPRLF